MYNYACETRSIFNTIAKKLQKFISKCLTLKGRIFRTHAITKLTEYVLAIKYKDSDNIFISHGKRLRRADEKKDRSNTVLKLHHTVGLG